MSNFKINDVKNLRVLNFMQIYLFLLYHSAILDPKSQINFTQIYSYNLSFGLQYWNRHLKKIYSTLTSKMAAFVAFWALTEC